MVLPGDVQQLLNERCSFLHVFGKLLLVQQSGIEVIVEPVFDGFESFLKTWRQIVLPREIVNVPGSLRVPMAVLSLSVADRRHRLNCRPPYRFSSEHTGILLPERARVINKSVGLSYVFVVIHWRTASFPAFAAR